MLLKKLTDANGVPHLENEIRDLIKEEIKDFVDDIYVDRMGNIIATKNSKSNGNIAISAHMDEAGLIVTNINSEGLIKFDFWGIDERNLVSQQVEIGDKKIKGVIGAKPIHLQKPAERNTIIPKEGLYIDIGATSKDDALKHISLGDGIAFKNNFEELGENIIRGKAVDGRVGCYALIKILQSDTKKKITACFTVQKIVDIRGTKTLAKQLCSDFILDLNVTNSSDTLFEKEEYFETTLGNGVAISLIDETAIYFKNYNQKIISIAKNNNIKYQLKEGKNGKSNAGNYFTVNGGIPCVSLSIPCRYANSSVSLFDKRDLESLISLVEKTLEEF